MPDVGTLSYFGFSQAFVIGRFRGAIDQEQSRLGARPNAAINPDDGYDVTVVVIACIDGRKGCEVQRGRG